MNQNSNPQRDLWMLGAVIAVPLILASGPLAGYFLGRFLLVEYLKLPAFFVPLFTLLGLAASGMQIARIIQRIREFDRDKEKDK